MRSKVCQNVQSLNCVNNPIDFNFVTNLICLKTLFHFPQKLSLGVSPFQMAYFEFFMKKTLTIAILRKFLKTNGVQLAIIRFF